MLYYYYMIVANDICLGCALPISCERLIVLPETRYCMRCSTTQRIMGQNVFPHKTGSEVVLMSTEDFNNIQRLDRRRTNQHRRR